MGENCPIKCAAAANNCSKLTECQEIVEEFQMIGAMNSDIVCEKNGDDKCSTDQISLADFCGNVSSSCGIFDGCDVVADVKNEVKQICLNRENWCQSFDIETQRDESTEAPPNTEGESDAPTDGESTDSPPNTDGESTDAPP